MSQDLRLISPAAASGLREVNLPRSKSLSNRALIIRALSGGQVEVDHLSTADDTRLLAEALKVRQGEVWLGHAGTALRFGLAWAAVTPGERLLRGSDRLSERPIAPLVDALRQLGADITYEGQEGFAPLRVRGRALGGGSLRLDASVSSQFITALMLIAPCLDQGLRLDLSGNVVSAPYLKMTARLMRQAGADVVYRDATVVVQGSGYGEATLEVEPDWSAASYFYAAVALNPNLVVALPGLAEKSLQGDAAVADLFRRFGVETAFTARGAMLSAAETFDDSLSMDFLRCPDLAQTVAATAAGLRIPLSLTGLQTLRVKETDRIAALANELAKCGVTCEAAPDALHLRHFAEAAHTPHIATYHDHRMAMAFAPLAFALGELAIEDPGVVSKSFPDFWMEMDKLMK